MKKLFKYTYENAGYDCIESILLVEESKEKADIITKNKIW